ncbi:CDP-glycerol glycerophosphotransferase family protein, partial [Angustibacter aerolatus]
GDGGGWHGWPAWATAAATVVGLTAEPVVRRLVGARRMWAAHLPGVPQRPPMPFEPVWAGRALLVSTAVGLAVALLDLPVWPWTATVLLAGLTGLVVVAGALRQVRSDRRLRRAFRGAVAAHAPEFVVYQARPDDASYQVTMWLPYLQRTGRRFMIVTRAEGPARVLAGLTDVPVVACRTSRELEDLLVPGLTTVFYVNAASGNGQMVRHSHLTHVHVGHGDSDKATSSNPTHAMYDRVFLAGQAAVERYAAQGVRLDLRRLQVVGRPQVELVEPARRAVADVAEPTVLYAPTWRGDAEATELYSLPHAAAIVQALLDRGVRVVFRPHPYSKDHPDDALRIAEVAGLLARDAERTGRDHLWGDRAEQPSVFECFNASDAMVCDVSSVAVDYLHSHKPMAMYVPTPAADRFVEDYPVARGAYLLAHDLSGLDGLLDQLLGDDALREQRERVRVRYLGDFSDEGYSDVFVRAVDDVVAGVGVVRGDGLDDAGDGVETGDRDVRAAEADDHRAGEGREDAGRGQGLEGLDGSDGPAGAGAEVDADAAAPGGRQLLRPALLRQLLDALSLVLAALAPVLAATSLPRGWALVPAALALCWPLVTRPPWRAPSKTRHLGAYAPQRVLVAATGGLAA